MGEQKGSFGVPSLGSISATCVPGATEEVQAFACTFKRLIHRICPGATMAQKAKALHVSPSLLSHWLNGRRLPRPAVIGELSELAAKGVEDDRGAALACEFEGLESLLQAARRSNCRRCEGGCACVEAQPPSQRNRGRQPVAPVPLADGGAGKAVAPVPLAPSGLDFPARLTVMALADRFALLRGLGAALDEGEIGAAADALACAGMRAEMEILIRSAKAAGRDLAEIAIALGGRRRDLE
ncbi:helix-turn-helix domain-containing protein [Streptomyces sp. NPDC048595]|uniref:helix-turn-helix domain-containing protein n=1 Tax=Streptomyces sp. NPDC048595 TaxID=3365576 RepID=UPI003719F480